MMETRLINVVEKAVWELMDRVLEDHDICKCEKCRVDIAALALNRLKPRYVVTKMGETIARADTLDQKSYIAVIVALAKAAKTVGANPKHS